MRCIYGIGASCSRANPKLSSRSVIALLSARLEIFDVLGAGTPTGVAWPFPGAAAEIATVADAEQQIALRPGDPFVQLARRMHDKRTRHHLDGLGRRLHRAAALEAE